jgi:hypothetical protein
LLQIGDGHLVAKAREVFGDAQPDASCTAGDEGALQASGPPVKELERRLLVAAHQVHTESGAHETELSSWQRFRRATRTRSIPSARGRTELEAAADALGAGRALLPW